MTDTTGWTFPEGDDIIDNFKKGFNKAKFSEETIDEWYYDYFQAQTSKKKKSIRESIINCNYFEAYIQNNPPKENKGSDSDEDVSEETKELNFAKLTKTTFQDLWTQNSEKIAKDLNRRFIEQMNDYHAEFNELKVKIDESAQRHAKILFRELERAIKAILNKN